MKTKHKIVYNSMPYGKLATIPKGTPVIPADNIPSRGYWIENWKGMTAAQKSWSENYGYHATAGEVE
tara:strand:+ start:626 stop:826 length:201 start_codon:yes stop_codon:yes gene_type:complete